MALNIFGKTYKADKKVMMAAASETFLYLGDDFEVNFRFITETAIKKLNQVYRLKNSISDVLSFKLDESEPGGDVVICYQELVNDAKKWNMSITDAAAFLLVHGILHLAGFDHTKGPERAKMEKAEEAIVRKQGIKIER